MEVLSLDPGSQPVVAAFGKQSFFDADLCVEGLVFHFQVEQPHGDTVGCGEGLKGVVDGLVTHEDAQLVLEGIGVDRIIELDLDLGDGGAAVLVLQNIQVVLTLSTRRSGV